MPRRIAVGTLNASTLDILNVIRQNASYEYQSQVPVIKQAIDIPKVGAVIYGTPALANHFLNALINRIAMVRVQSATFNNPYRDLKKGYIEYGETIEDIFVSIAKVVEYTPEKSEEREFKRTIPDVRSLFHVINWRVMYPVTIQDEDLKQAFLSIEGVQDLIAKIVDSVYTAAEYDEFLLFKYLLIKNITKGMLKPISIGDGTDLKKAAVSFRGTSNLLPFMSDQYNAAKVYTTTPRNKQHIFMDATFNAQFDVDVLASAFNMDKANFMGRLHLIDYFNTFDNKRFEIIRENSTGLEEVTDEELALMADVKAVLVDENFFQVYDNKDQFTEKYVASGLYWNYFYHVWKTVSTSNFSNAVVFVLDSATLTAPESLEFVVSNTDTSEDAWTISFIYNGAETLADTRYQFVQTENATNNRIAILPYGTVIAPIGTHYISLPLEIQMGGVTYTSTGTPINTWNVGTKFTFNKAVSAKNDPDPDGDDTPMDLTKKSKK